MRISDKFHKFDSTKLGRQLNYDLTVNLVLTYLAFFFAAGFLVALKSAGITKIVSSMPFLYATTKLMGMLLVGIAGIFLFSTIRYLAAATKWYKETYGHYGKK